MPRPNPPRDVLAEEHLARRVGVERERRGWTYEGLAKRMADAGCAINASAIYKIEKLDPPRRITVDELVGFSRAFDVPVDELLVPPELAASRAVIEAVQAWWRASHRRREAAEAEEAASDAIKALVADDPVAKSALREHLDEAFEGDRDAVANTLMALGDGSEIEAIFDDFWQQKIAPMFPPEERAALDRQYRKQIRAYDAARTERGHG
jgi:transcriptional regulator with XRE-family HTH domain